VLYGGAIMGIFSGIYHYFPKWYGRMMDEKLGNWHFWLNFIAFNLTFFPMHFAGMLGMPRRIYTYDGGQGWDTFNLMSSIGAFLFAPALLIFFYNFFRSKRNGDVAGDNPWDAATLEWSIPSPPPEYNFAQIPMVTSRYPLWDLTHPERMTDIPHSRQGWETAKIRTGEHVTASGVHESDVAEMHVESERKSAHELGIPMPTPTIRPLFVALGILILLSSLPFMYAGKKGMFIAMAAIGAITMVGSLYDWLTTPLEEHHEAAHH
jgi:cytochrome c oxidase subunit 1